MSGPFDWNAYARIKISPARPQTLRHADVRRCLEQLRAARPDSLDLHLLGRSVEGREIHRVTLGDGPRRVLLWSQMHGDEATHTAVLLDLIHLFQTEPHHRWVERIRAACTLDLIVMLNPDGAERFTRHNAQGIDINRDARRLQTPEGRLLMAVQDARRPHIALNLHDQHERTAVAGSGKVAAVSLLVPPLDPQGSVTPQVALAERIAGSLHRAVAAQGAEMVSRYDADYMPCCFGEAMQGAGVATVLVEAGGWPSHEIDRLVHLHFVGLLTTLHDLATDRLVEHGSPWYHGLERSSGMRLFDLLIRDVAVENGRGDGTFRADLGINGPGIKHRYNGHVPRATIDAVGDLHQHGGRRTFDGRGFVCLPGQIVFDRAITPGSLPDAAEAARRLGEGVTTIIGQIDLDAPDLADQLAALSRAPRPPINVGLVGVWPRRFESIDALPPALLHAAAGGPLLAIATAGVSPRVARALRQWNVRHVPLATLDRWATAPRCGLGEAATVARQRAAALGIERQGAIGRSAAADLVLVPDPAAGRGRPDRASTPPSRAVVLNGHLTQPSDRVADGANGSFLRR